MSDELVPGDFCRHGCRRYFRRRILSCPPPLARTATRAGRLWYLLRSHRDRHGDYQYPVFAIPCLSAHLRHHLPRTSGRQHGVCYVRLHHVYPRTQVCGGSKVGTLHEDSSADSVYRPARRHGGRLSHTDRSAELDVQQHPRHLYTGGTERLHLPHRARPLQRLDPLGRRRTRPLLRGKGTLPPTDVGLPDRRHRPRRDLAPLARTRRAPPLST